MDRRTCAYSSRRALITASRQRLASEVLGGERAGYGACLLDQLGQQLAQEFGRGFESRNLRRMVKFAEARAFYAQHAVQDGWSVRELNHHPGLAPRP